MNTIKLEDTMSPEEERAFDVFLLAVDKYLETVSGENAEAFESWLDEHMNDEDMLAHLLQTYPAFGEIFAEEIEK
ncbi:MAG: hypothetical protein RLZZ70_417, partial [Candidatus Parcubacteria bacterium]